MRGDIRDRLSLQGDLHSLAEGLAAMVSAHRDTIQRLIGAGYAPTPLHAIERLARELAEHEEQP